MNYILEQIVLMKTDKANDEIIPKIFMKLTFNDFVIESSKRAVAYMKTKIIKLQTLFDLAFVRKSMYLPRLGKQTGYQSTNS